MHIATNKPNVMELNAGAGKVEAGWSKAEGGGFWPDTLRRNQILSLNLILSSKENSAGR